MHKRRNKMDRTLKDAFILRCHDELQAAGYSKEQIANLLKIDIEYLEITKMHRRRFRRLGKKPPA